MLSPTDRRPVKMASFGLLLAFATTASASVSPPVLNRIDVPIDVIESIRTYTIKPHDGREPSDEYKREMESVAVDWLTDLGSDPWRVTFLGLESEFSDSPYAPLPQYLRVYGGGFELTVGFDDEINSYMSADEIQNRISFVGSSGFPILELNSEDWRFEASVPSTHIEKGIRVTKFGDGSMTLTIDTGFFAVYGTDRRVVPGVPEFIMPEFAYFQHRQAFTGEITLEMSIDAFKKAETAQEHPTWREIQHEAWRRANAPSIFELMSIYAGDHLASAEGQPAVTFRAHRTRNVAEEFSGEHMVSATITVFDLPNDSIKGQRWTGLVRFNDDQWYLERLYLSQKCRRGPDEDRWTSSPCE
ncbi:hypothetical protein [Pontixanthobacter aquaemixtae]|uniref:SnoaL-like domain-containing protein n=1 Tax=Pontixanthobacter aquaemixtae TaxID=1958940 RepID=A0A844ZNF0_9SPHN|nr:hypothetical protein [Pontixanthobacter aquaemixtae]MXO89288.1 hypothetical protein [Pontixanthobacter aquaemixtae]